jgi:hypothetical protein
MSSGQFLHVLQTCYESMVEFLGHKMLCTHKRAFPISQSGKGPDVSIQLSNLECKLTHEN